MDKKKLAIIAVVIIIAVIGVATLFNGPSTTRNPDELVVAATGHGGELESGFDPNQIRVNLVFKLHLFGYK